MSRELVPATPGLVALHEGLEEIPIAGFFKDYEGTDFAYVAAVANREGKLVPVTAIKGFKKLGWSQRLKLETKEEVRERTPSVFESIFGPGLWDRR